MKADIVIVGGAGHIGLPLGMLFANKGKKVILYDKDKSNVKKINNLQMPFMEEGGYKLLKKNKNRIFATTDKKSLKDAKIIIVCWYFLAERHFLSKTCILAIKKSVG